MSDHQRARLGQKDGAVGFFVTGADPHARIGADIYDGREALIE